MVAAVISIEPEFASQGDCLAPASVYLLDRAGYSAWDNWTHEGSVDLHLQASASTVEGQTTLVLSNDQVHFARLTHSQKVQISEVQGLLADLVDSKEFRALARSTTHDGANHLEFQELTYEQALARCPYWSLHSVPP